MSWWPDLPDSRNLFFVDTVGWDDPDANDDETFKDILLFIKNNNIANLKAVVWTGKNTTKNNSIHDLDILRRFIWFFQCCLTSGRMPF